MLGNAHFYHKSIQKLIVSFGTLFNDIDIIRYTNNDVPKEKFKVPLSYGQKEKYIRRITSDPNLTKSIMTVVPRMSFMLNGLSYDASRKQISTLKNYSQKEGINSQYVPVPFNFDFNLSIFVRNIEDGSQILEQILPFFTPDYTLTVDFINSMGKKYDIPIILNAVSSNIDFEGEMDNTRIIIWELNFTAKSYIWPPVKESGIIRVVDANIFNTNSTTKMVNIHTTPNPIDADPIDDFGYTELIIEY